VLAVKILLFFNGVRAYAEDFSIQSLNLIERIAKRAYLLRASRSARFWIKEEHGPAFVLTIGEREISALLILEGKQGSRVTYF
jgi:hypothetical protein